MNCKHPACLNYATGLVTIVAMSGTYASPTRQRVEVILGPCCNEHFPAIAMIGPNIKDHLKAQLRKGQRFAPLITYNVEMTAFDSDKGQDWVKGQPN